MLHSGDLSFSFSGLKTAVLTLVREQPQPLSDAFRKMLPAFQEAIVEVLVKKSLKAMKQTGLKQLVGKGSQQAIRGRPSMTRQNESVSVSIIRAGVLYR